MLRTLTIATALCCLLISCKPAAKETASDSTRVAPDSVMLSSLDSTSVPDAVQTRSTDEFILTNQGDYISNPFDFSLDSATVQEMLGPEAEITSVDTPGGEDELGSYPAFSFYQVTFGETKMSFYSYSGKHFADVDTPLITFRNGIKVGMDKAAFLEAMEVAGNEDAQRATIFTINDDYGFMSFYFDEEGVCSGIYVSYEEGD